MANETDTVDEGQGLNSRELTLYLDIDDNWLKFIFSGIQIILTLSLYVSYCQVIVIVIVSIPIANQGRHRQFCVQGQPATNVSQVDRGEAVGEQRGK